MLALLTLVVVLMGVFSLVAAIGIGVNRVHLTVNLILGFVFFVFISWVTLLTSMTVQVAFMGITPAVTMWKEGTNDASFFPLTFWLMQPSSNPVLAVLSLPVLWLVDFALLPVTVLKHTITWHAVVATLASIAFSWYVVIRPMVINYERDKWNEQAKARRQTEQDLEIAKVMGVPVEDIHKHHPLERSPAQHYHQWKKELKEKVDFVRLREFMQRGGTFK